MAALSLPCLYVIQAANFLTSEDARSKVSLYTQSETAFSYICLVSAEPMPESTCRKGNIQ